METYLNTLDMDSPIGSMDAPLGYMDARASVPEDLPSFDTDSWDAELERMGLPNPVDIDTSPPTLSDRMRPSLDDVPPIIDTWEDAAIAAEAASLYNRAAANAAAAAAAAAAAPPPPSDPLVDAVLSGSFPADMRRWYSGAASPAVDAPQDDPIAPPRLVFKVGVPEPATSEAPAAGGGTPGVAPGVVVTAVVLVVVAVMGVVAAAYVMIRKRQRISRRTTRISRAHTRSKPSSPPTPSTEVTAGGRPSFSEKWRPLVKLTPANARGGGTSGGRGRYGADGVTVNEVPPTPVEDVAPEMGQTLKVETQEEEWRRVSLDGPAEHGRTEVSPVASGKPSTRSFFSRPPAGGKAAPMMKRSAPDLRSSGAAGPGPVWGSQPPHAPSTPAMVGEGAGFSYLGPAQTVDGEGQGHHPFFTRARSLSPLLQGGKGRTSPSPEPPAGLPAGEERASRGSLERRGAMKSTMRRAPSGGGGGMSPMEQEQGVPGWR
ncbi:hypothetical protein HDU96_000651 [Phlyctochytrium bullatum]|nr:hypothetical protein HDU96_000651 [Phlyctochytrium bullatum]